MAGEDLNYYYLGHLMAAGLVRLSGVAPDVGYNLAVAVSSRSPRWRAFGLAAALGRGACGRACGGRVAAASCCAAGNGAGHRLLDEGGPLRGYDWFGASRVIRHDQRVPGVLVHARRPARARDGDPVLAARARLRPAAGARRAATAAARRGRARARSDGDRGGDAVRDQRLVVPGHRRPVRARRAGAAARRAERARARPHAARGGRGAAARGDRRAAVPPRLRRRRRRARQGHRRAPLPTWARDHGELYGLFAYLVATAYLVRLARSRHPWRTAGWSAAAALFAGSLLAAADLVAVGGLVVLVWAAAHAAFVAPPPAVERFAWLLIGGGLLCLLIPEVVYVKDSFDGSDLYRMNTVFKLGYQAWLLLALAGARGIVWAWAWLGRARAARAVGAGAAARRWRSPPSTRWRARTRARTASRTRRTSAGCAGCARRRPATRRAIAWLRDHAPRRLGRARGRRRRLLGVRPRAHLDLHRAADGARLARPRAAVGARPGHPPRPTSSTLYTTTDAAARGRCSTATASRYVVVGPIERADHGDAGVAKWDALGRRVFDRDGTTVWRLRWGPRRGAQSGARRGTRACRRWGSRPCAGDPAQPGARRAFA